MWKHVQGPSEQQQSQSSGLKSIDSPVAFILEDIVPRVRVAEITDSSLVPGVLEAEMSESSLVPWERGAQPTGILAGVKGMRS